jgi:hypothetical protein
MLTPSDVAGWVALCIAVTVWGYELWKAVRRRQHRGKYHERLVAIERRRRERQQERKVHRTATLAALTGEQPGTFADTRCANCGHSPESHHGGGGVCYRCDSKKRCMKYVGKGQTNVE